MLACLLKLLRPAASLYSTTTRKLSSRNLQIITNITTAMKATVMVRELETVAIDILLSRPICVRQVHAFNVTNVSKLSYSFI